MRVLKWLFQPAYLLIIIVLVALYVNREAIFPDEVAESLEVEALSARVDSLAERMSAEVASSDSPQDEEGAALENVAAASGDIQTLHPDEGAAVEQDLAQAPQVAPSAVEEGGQSEAEPTVAALEAQETVPAEILAAAPEGEATPAVTEVSPAPASEETALPVEVAPASAATASPPHEAAQPIEAWRGARAAVWQGELDTAVARYRQLIALQPGNYDAYGEMGNVLLAQSRLAAAIEAYATAARLIHRAGHHQVAQRLVGVIAQLDETQARTLSAEFRQR